MRRTTATSNNRTLTRQNSRSSLSVGGGYGDDSNASVSSNAQNDELDVYIDETQKPKFEGLLKKKSPKVSFGRHVWQQRYFILLGDVLVYKKEKDAKKTSGAICLEAVREVKMGVKKGRFDILVDSFDSNQLRVFALQAEPKLLVPWVNAITTWVNIAHKKDTTRESNHISYLFCLNYRMDPKAKKGICVCGAPKWSHKKPPPPPAIGNKATNRVACENFRLDPDARVIGNCRCGFLKSAHKPPPAPPFPTTPSRLLEENAASPKACLKYRENATAKNAGECMCGLPKAVHLFRPPSQTSKLLEVQPTKSSSSSSSPETGFWSEALAAVRLHMQEVKAKEAAELAKQKELAEEKAKKEEQERLAREAETQKAAEEARKLAWTPAWIFDARTVPNDWAEIQNMGKTYYYNRATNETSWEKAPSLVAFEAKQAEWEAELAKDPIWVSKPDLLIPGKTIYVDKVTNTVHDEPPPHWLTVQQREAKAAEFWKPSWILMGPNSPWIEVPHKFYKGVTYYYNMETKVAQFRKPQDILDYEKKVAEWEAELAKDPIWLKTQDAEGKVSYYNRQTRDTVPTKPERWMSDDELHPEKVKARKDKLDRVMPSLPLESWEPSWLYNANDYAHDWKEGVHNGGLYYYNKATGESSWQKPAVMEQQEAKWAEWKAELAKDPDWVEVVSRFGNVTYEHRKKKHVMAEKPRHWWTFDQREAERLEKERIKAAQAAEHKAMLEARIKPQVRAIHNLLSSRDQASKQKQAPQGGLPLLAMTLQQPNEVAQFYKSDYDISSSYDARRVAMLSSEPSPSEAEGERVMLHLLLASPMWSKDWKAWPISLCHLVATYLVPQFFLFDNHSVLPTNINVASFSTSEYYVAIESAAFLGWDARRVSFDNVVRQSQARYAVLEKADLSTEPRWTEEQWTKWWKVKYDLKAKEYLKLMVRLGFADDYVQGEEEEAED